LDSVSPDAEGILILDLRMPGMDGFQLQQKLKDLNSQLRIIFVTAHAKAGDREYAMAEGARGFLFKPFDEHSLLNLIQVNAA
jgi:FixJ family two-component response regulator